MIDRNSSIPMYFQLQELFIDRINRGELEPGSRTPTVEEICETYDLSRITVTKAFENLKAEGYLYSVQGKGYFVREVWKIEKPLGKVSSFTEEVKKYDLEPSSLVLECKRIPSPEDVSKNLNIKAGSQIAYIERVRKANGEALCIDKAYINDELCPGILEIDFSDKSLFGILRTKYHLSLTKAKQSLESVILLPEESRLFNLPLHQPGFLSTGTVFLNTGQPIEYSKQIFRGDRYRFVLEKEAHLNSWIFTTQQ
jgi:GntR family transcriptional regulator